MSTNIHWLRNDLRLHDNETLTQALQGSARVLLIYVIDLRLFRNLGTPGIRKTGPHRVAFLLQSLADLRVRLHAIGADLMIRTSGEPAQIVADLARTQDASKVFVQAEVADEELRDEREMEDLLQATCTLVRVWGRSLYHPEDLPFGRNEAPEPFRSFRTMVEKQTIRKTYPAPASVPQPEGVNYGEIPTLSELGFDSSETADPAYPGGETAALKRLAYYLDESHLIRKYRFTRNSSLGADYSSKFSPYLALGCLSPRIVYEELQRYSTEQNNRSGNKLIFEMRWRDFFLFMALKHGNNIFRPGGLKDKPIEWNDNEVLFNNWKAGKTGLPFIDAHMRELNATGFMSNRGRVNCASFLTRDYKIDWRWGAAWFENRLIDYEVSANWFNWHTQALDIYYTSAPWQGLKYDKQGKYVKHWLPELRELPAPLVHAPWKMEEEGLLDDLEFDLDRDYHRPQVENTKWEWAWNRLKTGDASSPRKRKKK